MADTKYKYAHTIWHLCIEAVSAILFVYMVTSYEKKTRYTSHQFRRPDSPSKLSVKRYLAEFLMDLYFIDIPYPLRLLLVKGIILNTRPKKSAHAYQTIWTDAGSPLLVYSQTLTKKVKKRLSNTCTVTLGMRYGNPSIQSAVSKLTECDSIVILPLFPQYSLAATESAIQKAFV